MDYYDDGYVGPRLSAEELDFLRMIRFMTWRMARVVAENDPEHGERFIDYLREELRRVRNQSFSAGLAKPKK